MSAQQSPRCVGITVMVLSEDWKSGTTRGWKYRLLGEDNFVGKDAEGVRNPLEPASQEQGASLRMRRKATAVWQRRTSVRVECKESRTLSRAWKILKKYSVTLGTISRLDKSLPASGVRGWMVETYRSGCP